MSRVLSYCIWCGEQWPSDYVNDDGYCKNCMKPSHGKHRAALATARAHVAALVGIGTTYWDEDIGCECNGCHAIAENCAELKHTDSCPVDAARRWLETGGE